MRIASSRDLGRLTKTRRLELGMTQRELAAAIGSTRQWVIAFESGNDAAGIALTLAATAAVGIDIDAKPRPSVEDDPFAFLFDGEDPQ